MCRGACGSREKDLTIPGATPEENFVFQSESQLRLNLVDYETF